MAWTIVTGLYFPPKIKMSLICIPLFRSMGLVLEMESSLTRMSVKYAQKAHILVFCTVTHTTTCYCFTE